MKILSFKAWKQTNAKFVDELEKQADAEPDCDECDGAGERECDMGHTHECPECEGTGKRDGINAIGDADKYLHEMYDRAVKQELDNLVKWGVVVGVKEIVEEVSQEIQVTEEEVTE